MGDMSGIEDYSINDGETGENSSDTPIPSPSELPVPRTFRCIVMPMKPISKVGSILIAESAQDTQQYVNSIGVLVAVGPSAFRSPVPYKGMDEAEMAAIRQPAIGDWVTWGKLAGTPFEWIIPGEGKIKLRWVNDDNIIGIIDHPERMVIKV